MSRRKSIIGWWAALAAAVVLATAIPASAQDQQRGQGRGRFGGFRGQLSKVQLLQAEQVQQELKLSDDQKQQVDQIAEDVRGKMREAFQGGGGQEAFARLREVSEEADEKLKEALKEDQTRRLQEIWLQVSGPAVLARDRELAEKLNVSREQRQKINEVLQAQGEKSREAFSSAQGEGRERFAAAREKLEEIRKETNDQIVALLSDEQKQQWKEMTGEPFELDRSQLRGGFGRGGRPRGDRN